MTAEFFDIHSIQVNFCEYTGPGGSGPQNFFSATAAPSRVQAIMARNPDSIDHTLRFSITVSGDGVFIGEVIVPAGSGVGLIPPVDCLTPIAPPQIGSILLPRDAEFQCNLVEALVDAVELDVYSVTGLF